MLDLRLDRQMLSEFLKTHQAVRAFEQLQQNVGVVLPETIEEAAASAALAATFAHEAVALAVEALAALEQLQSAPVMIPFIESDNVAPPVLLAIETDDAAPRAELGTISAQNADAVEITGGTIDSTAIGATTPSTGAFTTISATGQITSTLAIGTPPLVVTSTTKVANLNVDQLDGFDWAIPGALGSTTPNSAAVTTLSTTSNATIGPAGSSGAALNSVTYHSGYSTTAQYRAILNHPSAGLLGWGSDGVSAMIFGQASATTGAVAATWATLATGGLAVTSGFGCNSKAAQTAAASGGAVAATAATNVVPFGFTTAAQADGIVTLLNNIRVALVANGIMS